VDPDPELLVQFALEAGLDRLAPLPLAAWEFPEAAHVLRRIALSHEDPAGALDDGRGDLQHGKAGPRGELAE